MRSAMGRSAQMQSRHTAFHDPFRAADPFRTLDPFRGHDPFSQGMSFHAQHNLGSDSYNQFVEAQMQVTYTTIAVIFSHAVLYHLLYNVVLLTVVNIFLIVLTCTFFNSL